MSYWWFSLLLLSILAGAATSRGTVRLYFIAQLVANLAEYVGQFSQYYTLIYICATLLMIEMSVFLLWDAGVGKLTWKDALTISSYMTAAGGFGLGYLSRTEQYLLLEGWLFGVLGWAMLKLSHKSKALFPIGTLTWGMAAYDFLYLLRPEIKEVTWLPSLMCSTAFLWLAAKQIRVPREA